MSLYTLRRRKLTILVCKIMSRQISSSKKELIAAMIRALDVPLQRSRSRAADLGIRAVSLRDIVDTMSIRFIICHLLTLFIQLQRFGCCKGYFSAARFGGGKSKRSWGRTWSHLKVDNQRVSPYQIPVYSYDLHLTIAELFYFNFYRSTKRQLIERHLSSYPGRTGGNAFGAS